MTASPSELGGISAVADKVTYKSSIESVIVRSEYKTIFLHISPILLPIVI